MFGSLVAACLICLTPQQEAWVAEQARREALVMQHKAEWQAKWRAYPIHNTASDNLAWMQAQAIRDANARLYTPWRYYRWRR